jgi:hypothetical protein
MIKALVDYERLSHEFTVTEPILRQALFGAQPAAEVVLGYAGTESSRCAEKAFADVPGSEAPR